MLYGCYKVSDEKYDRNENAMINEWQNYER